MNHRFKRNPINIVQTLKLNNDLWNTKKERDALRQQLDDIDDAFEDTISEPNSNPGKRLLKFY